MTGIFAQVGKDMVNGFQMYLDDHKGGDAFGGATVKFIVEDNQAKGDLAVTKAKKLMLQDKVHMFVGGVLASTGYALAPVSSEMKTIYIASVPAADDLTQRQIGKYPYFIRTGWSSSQTTHPMGGNGLASKATRRARRSPPTTPSATNRSAASRRLSRTAVARSSRKSGRHSGPRI